MKRTAKATDRVPASRRVPIPVPSWRVSECDRYCLGYYRKQDGTLGDNGKLDHADLTMWTAHKWREDKDGYLVTNIYDPSRPEGKRSIVVPFHRLVKGVYGLLCDHRYGNRKDNRRAMLRPATHQENSWNRRKVLRDKRSSRFIGVTLHRQTGRWQAQSKTNGKNSYLGLFLTETEAAAAYNRHTKAARGRFAVLNRITPKMLARAREMAQARMLRNAKVLTAPESAKAAA